MRPFCAGIVIVAMLATPAGAFLADVTVTPEAPLAGEVALIEAHGWLPDPCWALTGHEVRTAERVVVIEFETAYVAPPEVGCIAVIVPYELPVEHVFTDLGEWIVRVVEHRRGPYGPLPDIVLETTVAVTAGAPTERRTWGTVKASYR